MKLAKEFYLQEDTLSIAQQLIGKIIVFQKEHTEILSGRIVETEAYLGEEDKASHAWNGRKTSRTQTMYGEGGISYVYLCYGIHSLFNIVTHRKDIPHAILIRAIEPIEGISTMLENVKKDRKIEELTSGPGKWTKAMGISRTHNALDLTGDVIWVEDDGYCPPKIKSSPRIGIDYAGEFISVPWRFYECDNKFLSK